ncbi:MAG: metalloprotease TldD [Erythrobacter sp.]|nr:metalloprotease TldD [Erythrobacter sp.]
MTSDTDPHALLYRQIDPDGALRLTSDLLGKCDDGELYLQFSASEAFAFDDGRLKTADYSRDSGFGLRGVSGETTGFAHANEISHKAIARAGETLQVLDPGRQTGIVPPERTNRHLYTDLCPLDLVPFAEKVALLEKIDAVARAKDPRVAQVSASLLASWSVVDILRPDGFTARDIRPLVRLNIGIVAEANGRRESGSFGIGGRYLYDRLFDAKDDGAQWMRGIDEAVRQALVNLESVAAPAGETTVLLGPGWPGVLLHEAVGHGLEGDFNRKGTSAFSGRIGERVAAPGVTVVDDGSIAERRGSLSIDDEGTPTRETVLIEDGILKGYMQDRLNARLMRVEPTGNGRRQSYEHAPMPRMTNTFMRSGEDDPAELLSRVKDGIYATSFGGGQVDIVSGKFVFACTEAYKVENGKIVAPIKGATLIGDGPSVLTRVSGIGDDMTLDEGVGICGKGGQSVPAGVGQPTLLIDRLTVGGTG